MNRERFISIIHNPELLKAEDAPLLESVLQEYPYFQAAHLLAARCSKISDSIQLQNQVKRAAAHVVNRKVLYYLLETPLKPQSTAVNETKETAVNSAKNEATASVSEIKEVFSSPPLVDVTVGQKEPEQTAKQEDVLPALVERVESLTMPLSASVTKENGIEGTEKYASFERSKEVDSLPVLESITNAEQEHTSPSKEQPVQSDNIADKAQTEAEKANLKVPLEIPMEQEIKEATASLKYSQEFEEQFAPVPDAQALPAPQNSEVKSDEKSEHTSAHPVGFVAWLKALNTSESKITEYLSKEATTEKSISKKMVENFANQHLSLKKPEKQEFYKPLNMAKQSVTDNDFFVTETLAKIYIKQGNLTKAIKVYQNLSLSIPEKSSIFAAQIKILKEQLQNKTGK